MAPEEFLELMLDATREIVDAYYVTDQILLVQHKPKIESIRAGNYSALQHAVHVTAYAR